MATDNLVGLAGALLNAYTSSASVTPSDGTDLTNVTRALFIGGAGNLVVIDQSGNTTTFTGVAAGTLRVRAHRARTLLRNSLGPVVDTWMREGGPRPSES